MARIQGFPTIELRVTVMMTEEEAAALDAIVGYGAQPFLDVFYKHLGEAYLKPHEKGLRSLFDAVRTGEANVASFLDRAKRARKAFRDE